MRATLCVTLSAASAVALAQSGLGNAVLSGVRTMQVAGQLPKQLQSKPTEPQGFPEIPPKIGPLPEPQPPTPDDRFVRIIRSGNVEHNGNTFRATDGAHVQYRGYNIIADEVTGDLSTQIFEATGNVRVVGRDATVTGNRVRVNYVDRTYRSWETESQLQPSLIQGQIQSPLYVRAKESYGSNREIFANDSVTTTCNYADPHYHFDARRTTVRPGTRAIFRDFGLVVLDKTILKLPYLSVPLNQPSYRYIPEFGRNDQDGYYVKARYGIPLDNPRNNFDARLDYFQKRGNAFGGDYSYAGKALAGLLSFYALAGATRTLNLTSRHQQDFGWFNLNLDANYQQNNFYSSPGATLMNTRLQLMFPQGRSSSQLSLYQNDSTSGGFETKQRTISLLDNRLYGASTKSNLDLAWVNNDSGSVNQEQVDVHLTAQHDLRKATAQFEYQRSIPVGTIENFFSASDRTPLLSLSSDSRRLFGKSAPANFPFSTSLSLGEFKDAATRDEISRGSFNLDFQRLDNTRKRSSLIATGRFQQGLYSDNTAQYILAFGSTYNYRLGADTGINLRYNYLRPYGFSPLIIDQVGRTNLISADMSYRPFRPFLVGVQTGYDLESLRLGTDTAYQFLGVRTEFTPARWFSLRALSNYDPRQQVWNSVRLDIAYRPGATFVSLGANYDGVRQVWGNANLFIDGLKWGRLSFSTLLQYNGYLQKLQTQHYSLIYDLHCAEAVLEVLDNQTGFRPGRQVLFFLRIKGLPFTSPFGVGSFGQALGTGGGVRF